jgi:hypothetical protein
MFNSKEKIKSDSSDRFDFKLSKYINSEEVIKEIHSSKKVKLNSFEEKSKTKKIKREANTISNEKNNQYTKKIDKIKTKLFNSKKNKEIFSSNELVNTKSPKIRIMTRPLSSEILPCKAISLNKRNGFNSRIVSRNIDNLSENYLMKNNLRKCLFSGNSIKRKKVKLKIFDYFDNNIKSKTPLDLLVEKIEFDYDYKLAHKKFLNREILDKFFKKHFKNVRDNYLFDKYFYVKSKLNTNTKSSENKVKSNDKILNFDNNKYKLFKNLSRKLKNNIKASAKKLDGKKWIEQIKKKENVENLAKLSELKSVIEDENILLTPINFLKKKKDPFLGYKTNQLVQKLNSNFTYKNRFIIAKKFGIRLEKDLFKRDENEKNYNEKNNKIKH